VSLLAEKLSRYFGYRNVDKKLFLPPPRTPWNVLPFSSQITSTSLQLNGNNNEAQSHNSNRVDDENDLILTMDIFYYTRIQWFLLTTTTSQKCGKD
jgi:hypothetical protein